MENRKLPVFVYGTLRKGHGNYRNYLLGKTAHEAKALFTGKMFSVHGSFPALLIGGEKIVGELMYIKPENFDRVLQNLDRLEGFRPQDPQHSMYVRREARVYNETDGTFVDAYVYYWNSSYKGFKHVTSGDWNEFEEHERAKTKPSKQSKEMQDLWSKDVKY